MGNGIDTKRQSSESMRIHNTTTSNVQGTTGGTSKDSGVKQLPPNKGAVSPEVAKNIKTVQDPETERPKSSKMPGEFPLPTAEEIAADAAKQKALEDQVGVQKTHLQSLHASGTAPKMDIATETFKLEGMALAANPALHGDTTGALNTHLGVPHPYGPENFMSEGATAPTPANIRDGAAATHSAYQKVLNRLESQDPRDDAAIGHVKTAFKSFKAQVAKLEKDFGQAAAQATINLERATNQLALRPSAREQRGADVVTAKAAHAHATQALATFKEASNHILVEEHREANIKGSLNWSKNSILHNAKVLFQGTAAPVLSQAFVSAPSWGGARTAGGQYVKDTLGREGLKAVAARGFAEGVATGASHEPMLAMRDGFQAALETTGLRVAEPIPPTEHFPFLPEVRVDDNGNIEHVSKEELKKADKVTIDEQNAYIASVFDRETKAAKTQHIADKVSTEGVNGALEVLHKEFAGAAGNYGFGTAVGDFLGTTLTGFGGSNLLKDALVTAGKIAPVGWAGAMGFSALGGAGTVLAQETGKLQNKHAGLPTHRMAAPNPRGVLDRLWNGLQMLNYVGPTSQPNRARAFNKMADITVSSFASAAIDSTASVKLEEIADSPHASDALKTGAKIAHGVVDYVKTGVAVQPFFSGAVEGVRAGKEGIKDTDTAFGHKFPTSGMQLAWKDVTQPGRPGSGNSFTPGSKLNKLVDKPYKIAKGVGQLAPKGLAMLPEAAIQAPILAGKGLVAGGKAALDGLERATAARRNNAAARVDEEAPPVDSGAPATDTVELREGTNKNSQP